MKALVRPILNKAAGVYAAGETIEQAMAVARRAAERGYAITLCHWHQQLDPADQVADEYLAQIGAMRAERLDLRLGIKLPGLGEHDELIRRVINCARDAGLGVDIDAHEAAQQDAVIRTVETLGSDNLGIAIPGCWQRSVELARWAAGKGIRVRIVKGGFPDPQAPAIDLEAGYIAVLEALIERRCREVAIATHDPALAARCLARLAETGTAAAQELLYGYPMEPSAAVGRAAGVPTRLYIPYGHAWVPYAIKRVFRNPKVAWFLAKDLLTGERDPLPLSRHQETAAMAD